MYDDFVDRLLIDWYRHYDEADLKGARITARLVRLESFYSKRVDQNLAHFDITIGEFDVLAALKRSKEGRLTPGALLVDTLVSSGGMTNRINRLEKRGFITRNPDPDDRRVVLVELTEAGEAMLKQAAPAHFAVERSFSETLTDEEQDILIRLLKKLLLAEEARS
ncbi:MarR family transcriptional regulator [Ignatzschineria sp. RMDPL8A]|uniref:MarR family winged helix-turn-helix transcriptional regulator n=1 Tax=Ignatzschineria sp. RMDPL8A TaxID=2999236 RepID=UPI00244673EC|nr:MarR family transcriptional regulator [Ignatzschineria sp. RMDPL8A]MDG9730645.1 MarR family transcriptional regulator [Ignatzschineria sp. RMDPL8A]